MGKINKQELKKKIVIAAKKGQFSKVARYKEALLGKNVPKKVKTEESKTEVA
jgi:hypothetical protein